MTLQRLREILRPVPPGDQPFQPRAVGPDQRFGGAEGKAGPIVRDQCIRNGLMVRAVRDTIVMSPPLVITLEEMDRMFAILRQSLDECETALREIP